MKSNKNWAFLIYRCKGCGFLARWVDKENGYLCEKCCDERDRKAMDGAHRLERPASVAGIHRVGFGRD